MIIVTTWIAVSARIYGAILHLYPSSFRRQFGEEMVCDFQDATHEAYRAGGVSRLSSLWVDVACDLIASLVRQWVRDGVPAVPAAWALSLCLIVFLQGSPAGQLDIPVPLTPDQETSFMLVGLAVVVLLIVATVLVTGFFWMSVLRRRARA